MTGLRDFGMLIVMSLTFFPAFGQSTVGTIEGKWFGAIKSENGDRHCWLSNRDPNGTYKTDFLTEDVGMFERYTEAGTWVQSANAFVTQVESKNGSNIPVRRLEYAIVEISNDRMVYRHIPSGTVFAVQRVPQEFQLPEQCGAQ
jgi:hypothetical protein